jgi:hypothetical protein
MRLVKILCCAAAIVAFTAPGARADTWNKKTFLTFSGPVQIPGTTLPAGTYVFQLADLESNRHVVQILEKDTGKLIATFLTVPEYKLDAPDKTVVMFEERPKGMPAAIKAWFYPGDPAGDEFVYPKSQAFKIAKESHTSVLAMNDDTTGTTTDEMKGAKVGRINENGELTAGTATPAQPPAATTTTTGTTAATGTTATTAPKSTTEPPPPPAPPAPNSTTVGTSGQAQNAAPMNDATPKKSRKLPRTGSELALFELLSAASLAGFFGARQLRKRMSDRT